MFAKLGQKFSVPDPWKEASKTLPLSNESSPVKETAQSLTAPSPAPEKSPFSSQQRKKAEDSKATPSPFSNSQQPAPAPAASTTQTPFSSPSFGTMGATPAASPFSGKSTSTSPFGSSATSGATFGSSGKSTFAAKGPSPSPFSTASAPTGNAETFTGSYKEMLLAFYQKYNPARVSEVDRNLAKYKGQEEAMFRKVANKYKLPASVFGLPDAPVGQPAPSSSGFGQPSSLGGPPTFGSPAGPPATAFGSPAGAPAAAFGGFGSTFGTTSSFGSVGQPAGGGFAALATGSPSPNPSPFGAGTAFGAPRR